MVELQFLNQNNNIRFSVEAISLVIASFSCIREVQVNDRFIRDQIQKVNDQRDKFINFCDDSKSLSNKLGNYSEEILSILSIIEENNFTREDLVSYLTNSLLPIAKKNKEESEEYERQIKQIKDNLKEIKNNLSRYSEEISNDEKNIESDTKEEFLSAEKKKKNLKLIRNCVIIAGIVFTGAAGVAAVTGVSAITGYAAAVEFVEVTLGMSELAVEIGIAASAFLTAAGGYGTYETNLSYNEDIKKNDEKIISLNAKLKDERKEFVNVIKMIEKKLEDINTNISDIVIHWVRQVNSLEVNIDKLEKRKLNPNLNKFDTRIISRNANEIKEKAHEYHRIMNLIMNLIK
ncbi:3313_t:CDS:1 [Diversispora eburnea]|uniref:3313_t:CDS:1 n=1 Tax=Diversispora eburnea TaxID=1213867 RepID=A0A9N8Z4Z3_9GLOM|nr:3313_t:CDS:1 [Diversispora eburnea]